MNMTKRDFAAAVVGVLVLCVHAGFCAASIEYIEVLKEKRFVQTSAKSIVPEPNAEYGFYASARDYFPKQVQQTVTLTIPASSRHKPNIPPLVSDSRGRLVSRVLAMSLSSAENQFASGLYESCTEFRIANSAPITLRGQVKLPITRFPRCIPTIINQGWSKKALVTGTAFTLNLAHAQDWPEGSTISRLSVRSATHGREQGGRTKGSPFTSFNVQRLKPNTLYDACVSWIQVIDSTTSKDPTNTHPFDQAELEFLSGVQVVTFFKIQTGP